MGTWNLIGFWKSMCYKYVWFLCPLPIQPQTPCTQDLHRARPERCSNTSTWHVWTRPALPISEHPPSPPPQSGAASQQPYDSTVSGQSLELPSCVRRGKTRVLRQAPGMEGGFRHLCLTVLRRNNWISVLYHSLNLIIHRLLKFFKSQSRLESKQLTLNILISSHERINTLQSAGGKKWTPFCRW